MGAPLRDCGTKQFVRKRQDAGRDRQPLLLIAVEQRWRRALDHGSQLPPEVVSILDTGVHALTARRGMDMCGVAREEDAAGPIAVNHPDIGTP